MSSNEAPAPPDYSAIANSSEKAAELAYKTSQEQLDWAKQQYADNKATSDKVIDSFLATQDENDSNAREDRARYESIYQPLEDKLAQEADSYASDGRKDLERGRAEANVSQNFELARQNAERDLEAYGVNPGSIRTGAIDTSARTQQAAAVAAAANQSDQQVDATGRALRSEAINVGRGYPGQIAGTYNTALQGGQGAVNAGNTTTATGASTMGTGTQWAGTGNQALGTWGNTLNQGYQNQLGQFNANQKSSSGWGSALGTVAGLATMFAEDGGAVPEDGGPQGAVPASASPTGGRATDDVPAQLTAGEFVIPEPVVNWYGEKHFQGLIEKAGKDRQATLERTGAVPAMRPARQQAPTYVSQGAI
jgi:hypothetical protein